MSFLNKKEKKEVELFIEKFNTPENKYNNEFVIIQSMIKDEESLKNWMKNQLNTIKNSSNKGLDQLEKILTQPGYRNLVSKFYSNELVEEILYLIQHYRQSKSKAVEVMEQILKDSDSSLENDKRLSLYCNMFFFCDQKLNKISLEM